MNSFIKLLGSYKTQSNTYNYLSMSDPKGKYQIPDNKIEEFLIKYHDYVFNNKGKCHLLERPKEYSSLKVDLDIKYNSDCKKKIYNDNHI
jgi:hypothetical protein